ncbi:MAG: TM2 domain-containing protein [Bacteroidota bacterium]
MENSNQDQSTTPSGAPAQPVSEKPIECKNTTAGICAILLGGFGIHKFVLGYNTEGIIILLLNIVGVPAIGAFTCGFGFGLYSITYVIPIIEGVIYLTKTDEEFIEIYQKNKRAWF